MKQKKLMLLDRLHYINANIQKNSNFLGRSNFYPLISEFSTYRGLESADPKNLTNAYKMADNVICLPMHHELSDNDNERVLLFFNK